MSTAAPERLILGVPSKGRLMEETANAFAAIGLTLRKIGNERGYRGEIVELPGVDVAFISASEIAWYLKTGRVHLGVTGEALVSEQMSDAATRVAILKRQESREFQALVRGAVPLGDPVVVCTCEGDREVDVSDQPVRERHRRKEDCRCHARLI